MEFVNKLPRANVGLEDLIVFFVEESVAWLAWDEPVDWVFDAQVLEFQEGQSEGLVHHPSR